MHGTIENTGIRKTYPQNWAAYNAAQTCEKEQFLELLHALCAGVEEPKQTSGRPRLLLNEAIFSICYKIFSTVSARRFMSDLRDAQEKGYISKIPHFNSIFNYLENPSLSPILQALVVQTSLPLASVEVDFAADSSGFTSAVYSRWYDHKYGQKKRQEWVKVHLMCGVKTHIVTAVEIKDKNASDTKLLPDLVKTTADNFTLSEVSADKAYGSYKNYAVIEQVGATPFIDFKSIHTGRGKRGNGKKSDLWAKMYHYFQFNKDEYMAHYHKRSNIETTFSMIKAKFGGSVRSKTETAMANEALCKIVCHNICVLIQAMQELGIDISFKNISAQKVTEN
jgi:transposase